MKLRDYNITPAPVNMKTGYVMYCRKSSESEDRQVSSIEDQLRVNRDLCATRGLLVEKEFTESKSAKSPDSRPVFQEMIEYIKTHSCKGIVCWHLNRLSRNPMDDGIIRWLLQSGAIDEIVTPVKIYLEVDSEFQMAFEGVSNTKFIKDLRIATMRGTKAKIEKGIAPILAPIGYVNRKDKLQGQRDIEPDDIQFPLMRKVFDLALSGQFTIQQLYKQALEMGVRSQNGKPLRRSRMYELVHEPFYTGRFRYDGVLYQGIHTPMLTDGEFDLLQEMYGVKGKPRTEDNTRAYNRLLKCVCGGWMTGERHKKNGHTYIYYRCFKHNPGCPRSLINVKKLEKQMTAYLTGITIKEHYVDWFIKWLGRKNEQQVTLRKARMAALTREYTDAVQKIDNLTELYISPNNKDKSLLTDEELKVRKASLIIEKEKASEQLAHVDQSINNWSDLVVKTFQFAATAKKRFETGTIEDKRTIMGVFSTNFTINGKQLDLTIREPFEKIQSVVTRNEALQTQPQGYTTSHIPILADQIANLYPLADYTQTYFSLHSQEAQRFQLAYQQLFAHV